MEPSALSSPFRHVSANSSSREEKLTKTTRKKVSTYSYDILLPFLRDRSIDQNLTCNGIKRGKADLAGNNCLLHTIFQQIQRLMPRENYGTFVAAIRRSIGRIDENMLSINDEVEGKNILSAVQRYLFEKTGIQYQFDLLVLFADNEGDIAHVDMNDIAAQLGNGGERISLRMILVNYNHYEPLFLQGDVDGLAASMAALSMASSQSPKKEAVDRQPVTSLPAYVINMPLKVDSDDEESDSSDEEENGRFTDAMFARPSDHFRLRPPDKKSVQRGPILKIVTANLDASQSLDSTQPFERILRLCNQEIANIQKQTETLIGRVGISVGFNKMRSLSSSRNRSLASNLNASYDEKIPVGKIGFLWDGVWQKKKKGEWETTTYKKVRSFYKQLKRRNPELARKFRKKVERKRAHMVPYREIRDAIKDHEETKRLVRLMRTQDKIRDVYLTFLDSDIKAFCQSKGALSMFSVLDENYVETPFEICSTGYTIQEPENPILELGVLADLIVRNSTAKHIKKGIYYPEPCTAAKVPADADTIPESFSDPKDSAYQSPQEMPRLIRQILQRRKLSAQQAMRFDARGAIVTTTPTRMQRGFRARWNAVRGVIFWGLPDFKTMGDINQSHFNARDWALNLIPALAINSEIKIGSSSSRISDQNVIRQVVTSLLSRLFNSFNPIEIARLESIGRGSFQMCLIEVLNDYQSHLKKDIPPVRDRKPKQPGKRKKNAVQAAEKCRVINKLWKWVDNIQTRAVLLDAIGTILIQEELAINVETIKDAAFESGRNLVTLFRSKLCMNYPDLVIHKLSILLDRDFEDVRETLPPLYREIMEGLSFQTGTIQATRRKMEELPEYYGVTPLHAAALAGNLNMVQALFKEAKGKISIATIRDDNGLFPLDYGLAYCQDNGINLELLAALWAPIKSKTLRSFSQSVVDKLDDDFDKLAVLGRLLADKDPEAIQIISPDLDLLICALTENEELADRLFECGRYPKEVCAAVDDISSLYIQAIKSGCDMLVERMSQLDDYEEALFDAMYDDAPKIDKRLLAQVIELDLYEKIIPDIEEQLEEDSVKLEDFQLNLKNLRGIDDDRSD